ncbi:hypothetical protein BC938DRAFT_480306 [Jimgerdemannia flammicorona]|uniref:Galactose oxidase n=1 Tax=Jimgerdemannia flammicorona TaxID=994334 RepID=A0A433QIW3_9FUNG|nr:hypothetical protein BC938DRAFT_480306 [Jimgerdemannia flammicorona]
MLQVLPVLFVVIMAYLSTAFTPKGSWAQTGLLLNNTIYVYGGNRTTETSSNLYALDVSHPWWCTNPAWVDRTSDAGSFAVPQTADNAMWPSADGRSFYVWGGGSILKTTLSQSGFAQYNVDTRTWSLPSAISNMSQQRREITAAWTASGIAYIWSGVTDVFTGNTSDPTVSYIVNELTTFDTKNLVWNVLDIAGPTPMPRVQYTATMLPDGRMVIIGGMTARQATSTAVSLAYVPLTDIPVFDTNTATWTFNNATGNIPAIRRRHTAVVGLDSISIIICCGGYMETVKYNDVAVLNTQTWIWTQPIIGGNIPAPRMAPTSIMVNGQMIMFFGAVSQVHFLTSLPITGRSLQLTNLNDINILDTRTTPFQWISNFSPTSISSSTFTSSVLPIITTSNSLDVSSGVATVGFIGGIIGITSGVLIVAAALIFLLIRWKKRLHRNSLYETSQTADWHESPAGSTIPSAQSGDNKPHDEQPDVMPTRRRLGKSAADGRSSVISHASSSRDRYPPNEVDLSESELPSNEMDRG